ncbi:MAG: hypothetical protein V3V05_12095 [Pontiella sp.]
MNKTVQLLIIVALLPMLGAAREETMEERKQRVTRKYLRERMNIAQSDMYVPSAIEDDEQVAGSKQYKDVEGAFERQEVGTRPPLPPAQPRPIPQQDNRNWLLNDASVMEDPFADPFNPYSSREEGAQDSEYWSTWGGRPDDQSESRTSRSDQRYDPYANRSSTVDSRTQSVLDPRASTMDGRTSIFGRREASPTMGGIGNQNTRTYGSSPESGMLQQPFVRKEMPESDRSRESRSYTPHKSPYQYDRNQRQQQGRPREPRVEYTKPNTYQQWKERNKSWDPTGDDAYLDEMMQKNRR